MHFCLYTPYHCIFYNHYHLSFTPSSVTYTSLFLSCNHHTRIVESFSISSEKSCQTYRGKLSTCQYQSLELQLGIRLVLISGLESRYQHNSAPNNLLMAPINSLYDDGRIDLTGLETPTPKVERSPSLNAMEQTAIDQDRCAPNTCQPSTTKGVQDCMPENEKKIADSASTLTGSKDVNSLKSPHSSTNTAIDDPLIKNELSEKPPGVPSASTVGDSASTGSEESSEEELPNSETADDNRSSSSDEEAESSYYSSSEESEGSEVKRSDSADLSTIWTWENADMTARRVGIHATPDSTPTGSSFLAEWQRNQRQHRQRLDSLVARVPDPNAPTSTQQQRDADIEDVLYDLSTGRHRAPMVQVKIGPGKVTYQVPFLPLAEESVLARRLLQEAPTTVNCQRFVDNNDILLPDTDPGIFDLFVNWLYHDLFLIGNFSNTETSEERLFGLLVLSISLQAPTLKNAVLEAITSKYLAKKRTFSTYLLKGLYCQPANLESGELRSIKRFALDLFLGNPKVDLATSRLGDSPEFLKDYFQRSREHSSLPNISDSMFLGHVRMHHWARHGDDTIAKRDSFDLHQIQMLLSQPIETSGQVKGPGRKPATRPAPTIEEEDCRYCQATGKTLTGKIGCMYCNGTGRTRQQASKAAIEQRRYKERRKGNALLWPSQDIRQQTVSTPSTMKRGPSQDETDRESKRLKPMEEYLVREKLRLKQEREDEMDGDA